MDMGNSCAGKKVDTVKLYLEPIIGQMTEPYSRSAFSQVRSAAEFKAANAEKSKYEEAVNIKSTTSYPSLSTPITPAVVQTKQVMNFKAALAKEETAPQQEPVKNPPKNVHTFIETFEEDSEEEEEEKEQEETEMFVSIRRRGDKGIW